MYERFTDRARKVMQLAYQEAQKFNHQQIGPLHMLFGILKEGSGVAANVLRHLAINIDVFRDQVQSIMPPMDLTQGVMMGRLPHTPHGKKVIEHAVEEARNLNHNYVGTEHALLGLLRSEDEVVMKLFADRELTISKGREAVLDLLTHDAGVVLDPGPFDVPGPRVPQAAVSLAFVWKAWAAVLPPFSAPPKPEVSGENVFLITPPEVTVAGGPSRQELLMMAILKLGEDFDFQSVEITVTPKKPAE